MKRTLHIALIGLTALLAGGSSPRPVAHVAPTPQSTAADSSRVADIGPLEVRIRKMHLVRPDLLHYPIQYDVYC